MISTPSRLAAIVVATTSMLALSLGSTPAAHAEDEHSQMVDSYGTLSGALIGAYAHNSNTSVSQYLNGQKLVMQPAQVDETLFADWSSLQQEAQEGQPTAPAVNLLDPSLGGGLLLTSEQLEGLTGSAAPVSAESVEDLELQLQASGLSVSKGGYRDLADLARQVTRSARTPDGAVTLASAKWASQLESLRAPSLAMPGTPAASMPGISADALPFGLLMNKSLINMVQNHPNLIGQAQGSGLGGKTLLNAWNTSMAQAYIDSEAELTSLLPSECTGVMMGVMATGDKSKAKLSDCGKACVVGGQYLHNQIGAAFDPTQDDLYSNVDNPIGGYYNNATYSDFSFWAQELVGAQNPELVGVNPGSKSGAPGSKDCISASAGARDTVGSKLPGVLGGLAR